VTYDDQGKIAQIRQSWDQGSLLKQLDVIGKTGRNWPIRDSTEQIRLITTAVKATAPAPVPVPATAQDAPIRSRGNSTNIMRDPHASLSLFAPREELESEPAAVISPYAGSRPRQRDFAEILGDNPSGEHDATPRASVISPYAGTRPRQRSFTEIMGDQEEDAQTPSKNRDRSQSPSKAIAPKIGAGKNYHPSRIFEENEEPSGPDTPEKAQGQDRFYRPNPKKYNHFEFADGSDPQDAPKAGTQFDNMPRTKHNSQWSFDDFVTPQKAQGHKPPRGQQVRHWGTEDDEVEETPVKKPVAHKPRRDAETHWELRDDGEPSGEPRPSARPRGTSHNTNLGLYENNLYSEDGSVPKEASQDPRALGNITNLKDRSKIFDPHFTMTDDSPHHNVPAKPSASEDRMKVVKMMESSWASYDESPAHKENSKPPKTERGIVTVGDGMGGKKSAGGRGWAIGSDSDGEQQVPAAVPGRKQGAQQKSGGGGFNWDF
jgi:hypothetical protein